MHNVKVTFVRSPDGDWEGMYIDGKLMEQGHRVQTEDVIAHLTRELDLPLTYHSGEWQDEELMELPDNLRDVDYE